MAETWISELLTFSLVGFAGKPNKLFRNIDAQGNVIIISEDGDASDPDDNRFGGTFTFDFYPPVDIDSIGLLDNGAFQKAFSSSLTLTPDPYLNSQIKQPPSMFRLLTEERPK